MNHNYDAPWLFFQLGDYTSCLSSAYSTQDQTVIDFFEREVLFKCSPSLNLPFTLLS